MSNVLAIVLTVNLLSGGVQAPPAYQVQETGWAYHYRPGLMELVARNRHMRLDRTADAYVSVPNCKAIGSYVLFQLRGARVMRGQVIDCSNPSHIGGQNANALRASRQWSARGLGWVRPKIVLEVNYSVARAHGQLLRDGKTPVTILRALQ